MLYHFESLGLSPNFVFYILVCQLSPPCCNSGMALNVLPISVKVGFLLSIFDWTISYDQSFRKSSEAEHDHTRLLTVFPDELTYSDTDVKTSDIAMALGGALSSEWMSSHH